MNLSLKGQRALICGASRGIGFEIAKAFYQSGAEICLLGRSQQSLEEAAARMDLSSSAKTEVIVADLAEYQKLEQALNPARKANPFTILINNAGGPPAGPLIEADPEVFLNAFATHVLAAQKLSQLLVPGMKAKKFGRIINVISTSVKIPIPNLGVSNTIRGAMANWSKSMANELGAFGITVNNILPGYTATERLDSLKSASARRMGLSEADVESQWLKSIPVGRFADPSETAQAALFLASPQASYINGVNLPVDGGRTGSL